MLEWFVNEESRVETNGMPRDVLCFENAGGTSVLPTNVENAFRLLLLSTHSHPSLFKNKYFYFIDIINRTTSATSNPHPPTTTSSSFPLFCRTSARGKYYCKSSLSQSVTYFIEEHLLY
jgi:hypothetical protein